MTLYTRGQAKSFVRSQVKELKSDSVTNNMLNIYFDLAQQKVQKDLSSIGIKEFKKTAFLEGSVYELPADIMPVPDAILDALASTGTRATINSTFTSVDNDIVFTARQPGTVMNGFQIQFLNAAGIGATPIIIYQAAINRIQVKVQKTVTTTTQAINAINNNVLSNDIILAELNIGAAGGTAINFNGDSVVYTLANGAGIGWKAADEVGTTQFNRMKDDFIYGADENYPKYVIDGDVNKEKIIRWTPETIVYSKLQYKYSISNMTLDADFLSIPGQYQELVFLDVERRCWKMLENEAKVKDTNADYEKKMLEIDERYIQSTGFKKEENKRIQTTDKEN